MSSDEIRDMAVNFRKAIIALKQLPPVITKGYLEKFPRGTCGCTSDLFMYYLLQKGINSEYWKGDFSFNGISVIHGWLKVGNDYLDLTADQFNYHNELNFSELIYMNMDEYPLMPYLRNVEKGIGCQGMLKANIKEYNLIIDVMENGYSEERIIRSTFNLN
ncbi:hypothetical protein ACE01U_11000 [Acinetobacter sp. BSP-153]|uniref:hypothetical protein n=1 Tax=Acinetobacter sp. BSP-153 TaxID=3344663 RepID=UPI0037701C55